VAQRAHALGETPERIRWFAGRLAGEFGRTSARPDAALAHRRLPARHQARAQRGAPWGGRKLAAASPLSKAAVEIAAMIAYK
jgi:hypothetical protein